MEPNYVWHIDGFDKLKTYGFSIHGCIYGYSKRVIWLEVSASNKCPNLIAYYYLNAAKNLNGILKIIKADNGTEHPVIEPIHLFLRDLSNEGNVLNSFSIVLSRMNQIVEAYWSNFRKDGLGWWKYFLHDLVDLELFDRSDPFQVDCMRFCFVELLREEVTEAATAWNQHIISHHRNGGATGRPDIMFFLHHTYDTIDHLQYVSDQDIDEFQSVIGQLPDDFSDDLREFYQKGFEMSTSILGCLDLYLFMADKIVEHT